jgi:hypothetical protein
METYGPSDSWFLEVSIVMYRQGNLEKTVANNLARGHDRLYCSFCCRIGPHWLESRFM